MFRRISLAIMAATCFIVERTAAQSNADLAFWKRALADKSINEMVAALREKSSPPWPRIDSPTRYHATDSSLSHDARLALIASLHEKVRQDFKSHSDLSLKNCRAYCDIAAALQRAGGYGNLLMADSLNRLAIFQLSGCLIKNIASKEEVKTLVTELPVPDTDITALLRDLASDDTFLSTHRDALGSIDTSGDLLGAIQSLGIPQNKITYELMLPANQSITRLLREPSAVTLLLRRRTTHLLGKVSLPGLLAFLDRGGKYEELNPADITSFLQRMAGTDRSFQDKSAGVKSLGVSHLLSLYSLHSDPKKRAVFLEIALD